MIKTILTLVMTILRNKNYYTEAKKIWSMVDENFRISETIEEKIKSKADEFDKVLLAKFPELTQDDLANLRQSIAGEVNKDKQAVVDNSTLLQQLKSTNTQLLAENATLKEQLSKVQSLVAVNTVTEQTAPVVEDNNSNVVIQA